MTHLYNLYTFQIKQRIDEILREISTQYIKLQEATTAEEQTRALDLLAIKSKELGEYKTMLDKRRQKQAEREEKKKQIHVIYKSTFDEKHVAPGLQAKLATIHRFSLMSFSTRQLKKELARRKRGHAIRNTVGKTKTTVWSDGPETAEKALPHLTPKAKFMEYLNKQLDYFNHQTHRDDPDMHTRYLTTWDIKQEFMELFNINHDNQ